MGYNIGPKIGIEGEAEFRNQIKKINAEYKTLEAETRAVTSAFEANGDEQGKLRATTWQLQKHIDSQKEKMALLQDAIQKATEKYKEDSIEVNRLKGVLYDTQATIAGLEKELKDAQNQLDSAGDAMESFEADTGDAGEAVVDFGDLLKANLASDLIMDGLQKIGDLVKDFASGTIEAAAEVKAAESQFSQTFGSMADAAKESLESISDDTDIAVTRMQGSYTKIFAFAKTMGSGSEEAMDIASRAMVAAADSAAYYDKSIEEVTETIQAFLKGNYANDAALGISATETTRNTKANELYAMSFQELSESQKVDVLLSMVEAGNAASGAIGQAARESDSWENVTGELSEAVKQLQAEAGKPALKKLTPIIQDITDSVYELIDDVDWEEFGETIEDVADAFIDNGPGILKMVASIGAGFVSFKAVQKAEELVTVASSFIQMGKAATTAGSAVAASGALAAASPWGLAATAIAAVAALVTTAAISAAEAESDLSKAMDRLDESFKNAESTYSETTTEIEGAAYAAEYYVGRLQELQAAGLDTAVAHREYEMTVEQLNELIPELNLTIDEQTGLIQQNTNALLADIQAWKDNATAQALQEKYTDILKARGEAEAELIDAQARLNILEDKGEDLTAQCTAKAEERAAVTKKLEAAQKKMANSSGMSADESERLSQEIYTLSQEEDRLYNEYKELAYAVAENKRQQEDLRYEIVDADSAVASYEDDIQRAANALNIWAGQTQVVEDKQDDLGTNLQEIQGRVDELAQSYKDARVSAQESIDSQIGLFDELAAESDWSASKIIENWKVQQAAFENYDKNLRLAEELGLDEALIEQLSDGSQESMQILQALTTDMDASIHDINEAFAGRESSKNALSDTIAEFQTDYWSEFRKLEKDAEDSGAAIVAGMVVGIDENASAIESAMIRMAGRGLSAFNVAMDINSPSGAMEDAGEYTGMGAVVGVDRLITTFEQKMTEFADAGRMAYLNSQLVRAASYPDMYSPVQSAGAVSTSQTTNYGGISIQIYPQVGQDANDIADAVMERLQTEVAIKEMGL